MDSIANSLKPFLEKTNKKYEYFRISLAEDILSYLIKEKILYKTSLTLNYITFEPHSYVKNTANNCFTFRCSIDKKEEIDFLAIDVVKGIEKVEQIVVFNNPTKEDEILSLKLYKYFEHVCNTIESNFLLYTIPSSIYYIKNHGYFATEKQILQMIRDTVDKIKVKETYAIYASFIYSLFCNFKFFVNNLNVIDNNKTLLFRKYNYNETIENIKKEAFKVNFFPYLAGNFSNSQYSPFVGITSPIFYVKNLKKSNSEKENIFLYELSNLGKLKDIFIFSNIRRPVNGNFFNYSDNVFTFYNDGVLLNRYNNNILRTYFVLYNNPYFYFDKHDDIMTLKIKNFNTNIIHRMGESIYSVKDTEKVILTEQGVMSSNFSTTEHELLTYDISTGF